MTNEQEPNFAGGLNTPSASSPRGLRASLRDIIALGIALMILFVFLLYSFLTLWPSDLDEKTRGSVVEFVRWFGTSNGFNSTIDARLLLLVMVSGAIGSLIHAATSFADFVGNERLSANWIWWYILRPFIGMALAAIFYVTIRAGFLTSAGQPATINVYGITSMAGLVGMFAKQATDKLSEVFDTVFRTAPGGGDMQRKDSLDHPAPIIASIAPVTIAPTNSPVTVTLRGSGFTADSVARVRDSDRPTTLVGPNQLKVVLPAADVATAGRVDLVVYTPPPGGGRSSPIALQIVGTSGSGRITDALSTASTDPLETTNAKGDTDLPVNTPTPNEALPEGRGGVA